MNITAVIMAGGKGTRIREINSEVPKPMIPIMGKPILQYEIEVLRQQQITDLVLVVGYLGAQIISYYGDGSAFGVHIRISRKKTPSELPDLCFILRGKHHQIFSCLMEIIFLTLTSRDFTLHIWLTIA